MPLNPGPAMDPEQEQKIEAEVGIASPERTSRRTFFFLGAMAAVGMAPKISAQKPRRAIPVTTGLFQTVRQLEVPAAPASWRDTAIRLLRRATFGPSEADVASIRAMGYQGWLNRQLKYTQLSDTQVAADVAARYPTLTGTPESLYQIAPGTIAATLQQATVHRAIFSQRQLYERMVEFWSDHFNIYVQDVGYLKLIDDRDVIRKHALGRFGDLVKASARSPAMLAYLDQNQSRVGRPNENYARELMELHTLGVDGGYSQTDVSELARVLTGWSFNGRGNFFFDPTGHDWGTKSVLGVTIPAGSPSLGQDGIKEGERIIDLLLAHPNTARFISTKMLRWLLTSEPTDTQIRTIAGVYRATGGNIPSMVRAILNDGWIAASPVRYKRPFHYLVSGMRTLGATVTSTDALNRSLGGLGQPLFIWETPDGYPDTVEWWAGNITPRWAFASVMSNYRAAPVTVDAAPYLAAGVDGAISLIDKRIFAGEISPTVRTALRGYLAAGTLNDTRIRETIGLALASSDFQWY